MAHAKTGPVPCGSPDLMSHKGPAPVIYPVVTDYLILLATILKVTTLYPP